MRYGVFDRNNGRNYKQFDEIEFEAKSIRAAKLRANKEIVDCQKLLEYNISKLGWRNWENLGAAFDVFTDNPVMYSEKLSKIPVKSKDNIFWRGYIRIFWRKTDACK